MVCGARRTALYARRHRDRHHRVRASRLLCAPCGLADPSPLAGNGDRDRGNHAIHRVERVEQRVSITVMGVHTADANRFRDRTYAVTAVGAASAADGGADSSDLSSPTAIRK